MPTAIFPGSFNPFTIGHKSVVDRALPLFSRIVIAIGINADKPSGTSGSTDSRVQELKQLYAHEPRVEVRSYSGLTTDFAHSMGATWILRGVRSVKDFEYEQSMADINRRLTGIETLLLFTLPEHAGISSSVVRELSSYGADISQFLPNPPEK